MSRPIVSRPIISRPIISRPIVSRSVGAINIATFAAILVPATATATVRAEAFSVLAAVNIGTTVGTIGGLSIGVARGRGR